MTIKPMLGDWEIPRIRSISTVERRDLVEGRLLGSPGSLFQDLSSAPARILIQGSVHGAETRDRFLEELRGRFRAGEPLTFVADILTATEVQYVLVEDLRVEQSGIRPDELGYRILLRESPPPPPPPDPLGGLDDGLLDQAGDFLDAATGALDALDALGDLPSFSDPTPPLEGTLDAVKGAVEGLSDLPAALESLFGSGG